MPRVIRDNVVALHTYCIPYRWSRILFRLLDTLGRYRRPVQHRERCGPLPPLLSYSSTYSSERQTRRSLRPSYRLSLQRRRQLESRPLGLFVRAELTLSHGTVSWPAAELFTRNGVRHKEGDRMGSYRSP